MHIGVNAAPAQSCATRQRIARCYFGDGLRDVESSWGLSTPAPSLTTPPFAPSPAARDRVVARTPRASCATFTTKTPRPPRARSSADCLGALGVLVVKCTERAHGPDRRRDRAHRRRATRSAALADGASINAFASCKSAVSKPSVNESIRHLNCPERCCAARDYRRS